MVEVAGKKVRGRQDLKKLIFIQHAINIYSTNRQYPWGIVDVENPEHCDFIKLRSMLITHMQDLQEVRYVW